jgi:hypothetical protein
VIEWFSCQDCLKRYENAMDLAKHIFEAHSKKMHASKYMYRCKNTGQEFFSPIDLHGQLIEIMAYHRQVPDGMEKYT